MPDAFPVSKVVIEYQKHEFWKKCLLKHLLKIDFQTNSRRRPTTSRSLMQSLRSKSPCLYEWKAYAGSFRSIRKHEKASTGWVLKHFIWTNSFKTWKLLQIDEKMDEIMFEPFCLERNDARKKNIMVLELQNAQNYEFLTCWHFL